MTPSPASAASFALAAVATLAQLSTAPSIAAGFRRSSFCGSVGCVEVAALPGDSGTSDIVVRDAKDKRPDAPILRFTTAEWDAFVNGVLAGEFSTATLSRT